MVLLITTDDEAWIVLQEHPMDEHALGQRFIGVQLTQLHGIKSYSVFATTGCASFTAQPKVDVCIAKTRFRSAYTITPAAEQEIRNRIPELQES